MREAYNVSELAIHSSFDKSNPVINDIALLYLKQNPAVDALRIRFQIRAEIKSDFHALQNSNLEALQLVPDKMKINARLLTAVGTEEDYCHWSENVICGKAKEIESHCDQDFGGPVVNYDTNKIVGIIPYNKGNCSQEHAEQFIRTDKYVPWIDDAYKHFSWLPFK